MKKIFLTAITLLLLTNQLEAQGISGSKGDNVTDLRKRLMFGAKGAVNYSKVYDTRGESFNVEPKLGLAVGMFLAIPIDKYLGIQPEILISQRGFKATSTLLGSTFNLKRTATYIDVPILFAFKPDEFITLLAGPQYSYLAFQKDVFTKANTTIEFLESFKNSNVRKNTLCFTAGFDMTLKHIVVSARAGWDILNNNGDGTATSPRYKNTWYQFGVGYRIYKD